MHLDCLKPTPKPIKRERVQNTLQITPSHLHNYIFCPDVMIACILCSCDYIFMYIIDEMKLQYQLDDEIRLFLLVIIVVIEIRVYWSSIVPDRLSPSTDELDA